MDSRRRFLVLHRNRLFRDCLCTYLAQHANFQVAGIDHVNADVISHLESDAADVILLDLQLPGEMAVEVVRAAAKQPTPPRILLLVSHHDDCLIECIAAGVHGCVLEQSSLEDLQNAIEQVLEGDMFCSPDFIATMFQAIAKTMRPVNQKALYEPKTKRLTLRELEVLELLNQRKSNKEIASALSVSLFTVKNHVRNILDKLNAENRMEAVDLARERNHVPSPHQRIGL